jgi:formate hydrogenlyase subunit 3/multisubunit Na+/H+ antiporter MnhD subunit
VNNGWRDALLAILIIATVIAVACWAGTIVLVVRMDGDLASLPPGIPILAGVGSLAAGWAVTTLVLWICVSAVVREHHADRELAKKLAAR